MTDLQLPRLLKSALAAGTLLGLSGCMYGGTGYYGDGYVNNGYACDPYAPFDDYYACDYGYGFANIGFGGGWYDQYYYPGYGVYIFDRGGRRHAMKDNHRRHWARQRAEYGGHHPRDRTGNPDRRYQRGDRTGDERRGHYRNNNKRDDRDGTSSRNERGDRPATGRTRQGTPSRAAPVRNRGDRTDRRPATSVRQPQARPRATDRSVEAARPARPESPRYAPRSTRSERKQVSDD
jgi:hypothetical protein